MNTNHNRFDPDFLRPGIRPSQGPADSRVRYLLADLDLNYQIDPVGNYLVPFTTDELPLAVVVINSKTQPAGETETRAIWMLACLLDEAPERDEANQLLMQNAMTTWGRWVLKRVADGYAVIFAAILPADATPDQLRTAISMTMGAATCGEARHVFRKDIPPPESLDSR
jgi:hypothetical protein